MAATRTSAGLVLYRRAPALQVLLGHMGGPFWARKDDGAWSIPKGEYGADEDAFAAAAREFEEELGSPPPDGGYLELGEVRQANGKVVIAWAVEGDLDADAIVSNTFELRVAAAVGAHAVSSPRSTVLRGSTWRPPVPSW